MRLSIEKGVREVDPADWDRLDSGRSPFLQHAFLAALEESASVGPGTGWQPLPILLWEGQELVGAAPAYLKGHSYGEYVFDWAWAQGAQRAGIPYYPKLVVAVPFTPAVGRRILALPGSEKEVRETLARALPKVATDLGASSVHWLLPEDEEQEVLVEAGYLPRFNLQFHWRNRGWDSFDDYLASMRSKRRREIRRERRRLSELGVEVTLVAGKELTDAHWSAVERFYRDTCTRKWGQPYLTPGFFEAIRASWADQVRFFAATRDQTLVGGALCFEGDGALYGRYWGCDAPLPGLHFETCFYSPLIYCLENGLELYEAGAQGQHKIPRGFLPTCVHSAHWIAHPGLRGAVADFLEAEAHQHRAVAGDLSRSGPF